MLVNRAAIILKAKQPAVDWINEVDPIESDVVVCLSDFKNECMVYLVPDEIESIEHATVWCLNNAELLLEDFFMGWYQDEAFWPKKIGPNLFQRWFDVEYHSMIIDTVNMPLTKAEF